MLQAVDKFARAIRDWDASVTVLAPLVDIPPAVNGAFLLGMRLQSPCSLCAAVEWPRNPEHELLTRRNAVECVCAAS